MEEVITPYIIDNNTIQLSVTPRQLEDIRSAVEALNKRRVTLREKMATRRVTKGNTTKPCKPIIRIDFPQRGYSQVEQPVTPPLSPHENPPPAPVYGEVTGVDKDGNPMVVARDTINSHLMRLPLKYASN